MSIYTRKDLAVMQAWPLERKIRVTQTRIYEWYVKHDGLVFLSFSGGKDSTVLLDLARRVCADIPAIFVDTGMEYPELRAFVKGFENVTWLKPRYPFSHVIEKYGYPVISKEVADVIDGARKGQAYRTKRINGELLNRDGNRSKFNCEKYKYLMEAPFKISARCCYHMKKAPIYKYERETGRRAIIGTMACESALRMQGWLNAGCNAFDAARPISRPLSFWTEQDILGYLQITEIPYAPIYGDIIEVQTAKGIQLKTTGVERSGCMFCMFGVQHEPHPNRFQKMQITHPKQYDYCVGKLGCGAVMDFIGVPYTNPCLVQS